MNEHVLISLCVVYLGMLVALCTLIIIGATIFDLQSISQNKQLKHAINKLSKPRQPTLTVLVLAHNDATTIELCLKSLSKSTYKNYQIVVIDNASSDGTQRLISQFARTSNSLPVTVFLKRKPSSDALALLQGLNKVTSSQFVFVLQANTTVLPSTIKQGMAHFNLQNSTTVVQLSSRIVRTTSLFNFSNRLAQLSLNQCNKSTAILPIGPMRPKDNGTFYTTELFSSGHKAIGAGKHFTVARKNSTYANLSMQTSSVASFTTAAKMPSVIAGAAQLLLLVLINYALFAAFTFRTANLLFLSWIVLMVWLLFVVWADDHSTVREKFELSYGLPMTYILMYLQLVRYITLAISRPLLAVSTRIRTHEMLMVKQRSVR